MTTLVEARHDFDQRNSAQRHRLSPPLRLADSPDLLSGKSLYVGQPPYDDVGVQEQTQLLLPARRSLLAIVRTVHTIPLPKLAIVHIDDVAHDFALPAQDIRRGFKRLPLRRPHRRQRLPPLSHRQRSTLPMDLIQQRETLRLELCHADSLMLHASL